MTPLHHEGNAAPHHLPCWFLPSTQVLVRHKADPAATDHDGKTPLDLVPSGQGVPKAQTAAPGGLQGCLDEVTAKSKAWGKPIGAGAAGVPRASLSGATGAGEQGAPVVEQGAGGMEEAGAQGTAMATRGDAVRKLLWSLAQGVNEAAAHGDEWRIKHLVEMGATVQAVDAEGYTALGRAVAGGFRQVRSGEVVAAGVVFGDQHKGNRCCQPRDGRQLQSAAVQHS